MRALRVLAAVGCFTAAIAVTAGSEPDAIKSVTAAGGKITYDKVAKKKVVGAVALQGAKTTDETLKDLPDCPALTRVEVRNAPKVTAAGIADVAKVKKLQKVELQGAVASDDAATALAAATTITDLQLSEGGLTDEGVKQLAALTKLQSLTLTQNPKVKGTTIPALVAAKDLNSLTVTGCPLGDLIGWSALKKLPKLTTLSLARAQVTDAGLKELGQLAQLTTLSLEGTPLTDAGLAELVRLRALKSLTVMDTKITDEAVATLSQMKQLTYLGVSEKQVGKDGGEALKKALPKCDVEIVK